MSTNETYDDVLLKLLDAMLKSSKEKEGHIVTLFHRIGILSNENISLTRKVSELEKRFDEFISDSDLS